MVGEGTGRSGSRRKLGAFGDWLESQVEILIWMPALFLISGVGTYHSLRRRGPGGSAGAEEQVPHPAAAQCLAETPEAEIGQQDQP